ncbi:MAG: sialate O-acetylesterase [Clostridiales Family XIII bacterium]|jgi:hypothetical protein|nr:sialate O-acetylesterase [Clostridiales Family XIII bacterium]
MLKNFREESFDVILQGGQSNSEGCGVGRTERPFSPDARIWYFNGDFTISPAVERVWENEIAGDASLTFAEAYMRGGRLAEGRKLLIVRASVGGTGFADMRWGLRDDLYLRMLKMTQTALALNPANRLVAFLWHQGENEAGSAFDTHFKNVSALLRGVREAFENPTLPFVTGGFVPQWERENQTAMEPIANALRAVCEDAGFARFVDADGLTSNEQMIGNGDILHFSRDALHRLGLRYYEAFAGI